MLDLLFRRSSKADTTADSPTPEPVISKPKGKQGVLHLNTGIGTGNTVSAPISVFSNSSPNRTGPPNVAWLDHDDDAAVTSQSHSHLTRQMAVRVHSRAHIHPIGRSASSPPMPTTYSSTIAASKSNARLHSNAAYSRSTHSLRLDPRQYTYDESPAYGYSGYPLVKQLSPIAEQDYFSPEGLRRSNPLPPSEHDAAESISYSRRSVTPNGSQSSDITRPSPVYIGTYPTFISRSLNRTVSQTSSRTQISTSSIPHTPTKPSPPPSIPPLDLRPPFPGPHPSRSPTDTGPPLRPPKPSTIGTMPTIAGSSESYNADELGEGSDDQRYSLHAESYVTAADDFPNQPSPMRELDITEIERGNSMSTAEQSNPFEESSRLEPVTIPHVDPSPSTPSLASSFDRMADRNTSVATGLVSFPEIKTRRSTITPACWIFWLGFFCPPLWMIGGWYFTILGEPPRLTWWTLWTRYGRWRGFGKKKILKGQKELILPRWVVEKSDGASQQNTLRGISFGYPFVAPSVETLRREVFIQRIPGVRVTAVGPKQWGRLPSSRRVIDPWIERCRLGLFTFLLGLCLATIVAFIVVNA